MYILKHNANICNCIRPRSFKTRKTLRQFLRRHKWKTHEINLIIHTKMYHGWMLIKE